MNTLSALRRSFLIACLPLVFAGCNRPPKVEGDYRDGSQLFRIRNDDGQISLENWDMKSARSAPVIVVPLTWQEGTFRGNAQLVGELSIAKTETGLLVLGAGKRWEPTPVTLPPAIPAKDDAVAGSELVAALKKEVDARIDTGKCGGRNMTAERSALIRAWFATLKPTSVAVSPSVETPFLTRRKIDAAFNAPAFAGPEGTVSAFEFALNGKDSRALMPDLGADSPAALDGVNGGHRPWGNLGDLFCEDLFFSKKFGAGRYTDEPAPKPVKSWFR